MAGFDRANILVLDDESDTQDLFLQMFRKQIADGAYAFSFAQNAEKAEELLAESPFDVLLTDISVNGVDCIEFISKLRQKYPIMKSVVVSAYGDINTLRAVMRSGAHDFVIKPIDYKDLSETLEKAVHAVMAIKQAEATNKKFTAISNELSVSANLQKSMLPGNSVKKGSIELWADTLPAAEVGGDFYDYFWLSDTKLGVVIADVSGKNVSAAMFALMTKTLVKSFARLYHSPAECFRNVNTCLCGENVATMFVTALYGIVDLEKNEFVYTNAGHLPIGVVCPNQEPQFLECETGMALGIWEETEFIDNYHKFSPGESMVMYTDGVTEAADIKGDEYDFPRLHEVLKANSKLSPNLLTQAIVDDIHKFTKGAMQSDDITTVCLKYRLRVVPNAN